MRIRAWLAIFAAAAVAAYAVDFAQHGVSACWRLLLLLFFVPGLWGFQFGVDLDAMERRGTQDYLNRVYDAQAAARRLRFHDDVRVCTRAFVVAFAEWFFVFGIDERIFDRASIALPLGVMAFAAIAFVVLTLFMLTMRKEIMK